MNLTKQWINNTLNTAYTEQQKERAIHIAEEYLARKYSQKMTFVSIRYPKIDPVLYHVEFSPISNPKIIFEVIVHPDMTIRQYAIAKSVDNYYLMLCEYQLDSMITFGINDIWNELSNQFVIVESGGVGYSYDVPEGVSEETAVEELIDKITYYLSIHTETMLLSIVDVEAEAQRIMMLINRLKESELAPSELWIWYKIEPKSDAYPSQTPLYIKNWSEISEQEIEELLTEEINYQLRNG